MIDLLETPPHQSRAHRRVIARALHEALGGVVGVSAPDWDWIHLVGLDEGLTDSHRHGTYLALCGVQVAKSDLPGTLCSGDCDREHEHVYCLVCLRVANERNGDAGWMAIVHLV